MGDHGRAALGAVAATALAAVSIVIAAPSGQAAAPREVAVAPTAPGFAEGFRVETRTTYTLDPAGGAVHVVHDATLTNQKPSTTSGSYITTYFLPTFGVPVLSEAVNVVATAGGAPLPVQMEGTDSPRFEVAVVDLQPDLVYGATQTVHLTYDLPKVPPRSDGFTRLNDAYATFPALAIGDPGLTSVEIQVPEGFEVELVGSTMEEAEREGRQVFTAEAIADPATWEVLVSARDDSKLLERMVDVGEAGVKVLGWPDDPEWADFAETQVADGVPVLEELIGIDWPADATVEVVETSSPYLYGYAGWYMPVESLIEVGDELDAHVMLHELAHLWFNDDLFEGRWINEAFADTMAAAAIAELDGDAPTPKAIEGDDPGKLKLNDWSNPDLQAGRSDAQERYGYNTSWSVMAAVLDEIGMEELAGVIQAADAGQVAYRGPGVPEELYRTFDWKELLDLLEEVGGSSTAAALFERHVVGTGEGQLFTDRSAARERYAELLEAGEGWAAPSSVRLAMTDWRFAQAEGLMDDAAAILETKAELAGLVADLDVDDHLALQDTYEAGKDLGDVAEAADEAVGTATRLGEAEDSVDDGAGPLGALGLLFAGAGDELDDAQRAFEAGDYEAARAAADDAEDVVDGANAMALLRILGLVLLVAVVLVLRRAFRGWRGRRSDAAREPLHGPPVPPGLVEAGSEPDGAEGVGGAVDDRRELGV